MRTPAFPLMAAVALSFASPTLLGQPPENVILFVGDGMGSEHIKAANSYVNGPGGSFNFEGFPHQAKMTHNNSRDNTTDSAASGTALATGFKVGNGVISRAIAPGNHPPQPSPENGQDLETLLERFQDQGKSTGLVTNSFMTDATPAAFGAHADDRSNDAAIANDFFTHTKPSVLFGGATANFHKSAAQSAGYDVVTNRTELNNLNASNASRVAGMFGNWMFESPYDQAQDNTNFYDTKPYLDEMTGRALDVLNQDDDGYFLMVENELLDEYGHANDLDRSVFAMRELAQAVQSALDHTASDDDTLVLVTGDHETGGLDVTNNTPKDQFPEVTWSTHGHTQTKVPAFAKGPNADLVSGTIDNTDVPRIATVPAPGTLTGSMLLLTALGALQRWRPARGPARNRR